MEGSGSRIARVGSSFEQETCAKAGFSVTASYIPETCADLGYFSLCLLSHPEFQELLHRQQAKVL
jgi:hypothetical protein